MSFKQSTLHLEMNYYSHVKLNSVFSSNKLREAGLNTVAKDREPGLLQRVAIEVVTDIAV